MTPEEKVAVAQRLAAGRAAARARRAAMPKPPPTPDPVEAVKAAISSTPAASSDNADGRVWISPSGEVVHLSEQPPWAQHVIGKGRDATDARQFVDVPKNWVLRWRSPKSLDTVGQLGWMPVTTATPNVKPIVRSMVSPEGLIRRGFNGDILHFMPREWWDNRLAEKASAAARLSGKSMANQQQFLEDANRGKFGRAVKGGWDAEDHGRFPVATGFDARSGDHPT